MTHATLRKNLSIGISQKLCFASAVCASLSVPAYASEGGQTQWPLGVQTVAPAILPPPGKTALYGYSLVYSADRYNDKDQKSAIPGFEVNVAAQGLRAVHTWNYDKDGINLSSGLLLVGNRVSVEAAGARESRLGLNYLYVTPLYVKVKAGPFHIMEGPSVFIPISDFKGTRLANTTNNYYSFNNELVVTYAPNPRLDISVENTTTINAPNHETGYKSGTITNFDFGINYAILKNKPNLHFGISGFYAKQLSDDKINGAKVGDGNRLEAMGVGPQIVYYPKPGVAFVVKYQREVVARNTTQGNRFWFEFAVPI